MGTELGEIKICSISRKVLKYSMLWPIKKEELNPGIRYKLTIFAFFSITGILVFSITLFSILEIKSILQTFFCILIGKKFLSVGGYDVDAEELAVLIAIYGTYYMVSAYLYNQHQIALLLRDLSEFKNFGKPPGFEELNNHLNFLSKLLVVYSFLAALVYNGIKVLQKSECKKNYEKKGLSDKHCGLLANFLLPVEIDYFPVFELILLITFLLGHLLIKLCMHVSFNAFEIVNHIVLRIEHLKTMILDCFNCTDQKIIQKKLKICILYHIEILR